MQSDSSGDYYSGFLEYEEVEGSDNFVRRFFVLDYQGGRLHCFADKQPITLDHQPISSININFVSFVSDASSSRPKLQCGFYVIESGQRRFFRAFNEQDKQNWIQRLQDASKISVPPLQTECTAVPQHNGCRVEIFGGVAHMTSLDETARSVSCSTPSINSFNGQPGLQDTSVIKVGYCVKQGGVRKNWKRRFFKLDSSALSYYASHQDKSPLRRIQLSDVNHARISMGIHLNRLNVYEIVTPVRVYYVQAETSAERDAWIKAINDVTGKHLALKVL